MSAQVAADRLGVILSSLGGQLIASSAEGGTLNVLCRIPAVNKQGALICIDKATELLDQTATLQGDISFRFYRNDQNRLTGGYRFLVEGPEDVLLAWADALGAYMQQVMEQMAGTVDRKSVTKPNGGAYSYPNVRAYASSTAGVPPGLLT